TGTRWAPPNGSASPPSGPGNEGDKKMATWTRSGAQTRGAAFRYGGPKATAGTPRRRTAHSQQSARRGIHREGCRRVPQRGPRPGSGRSGQTRSPIQRAGVLHATTPMGPPRRAELKRRGSWAAAPASVTAVLRRASLQGPLAIVRSAIALCAALEATK
ncbi:uncharacterized protein Tco025E_06317, partial [Trypanosoma conorhini]